MNENDNMNLITDDSEKLEGLELNFDRLEELLESELDEKMTQLEFLKDEEEQIGDLDALGETIKDVVWEQFLNQIAVVAGNDFIEANRGLTLDLRKEAHIQTTENFANGKIASHNTEIDYQKRYDDWQNNFVKDEKGNIVTHKNRVGNEEATLKKNARKPFDKDRPTGNAERHTDMDHTISAAELIRDPSVNAHMSKDEQIAFANSDANLYEMDSSLNRSKGDLSTSDWLDNPNANGQKPSEVFDIGEEKEKEMRQKEAEANEELEKRKKEGEERSIKAGKESMKKEAFKIGGKALRTAVTMLLAELVKEIIGKLIMWFKSANREIQSFLDSIKEAIKSFASKICTHLINAGKTMLDTILAAMLDEIYKPIKKVCMLFKQGFASLKSAIEFLKDPKNKNMPFSLKMLEVGKLLITGASAGAAILLGEVIETGLHSIPVFAVEIPLLGSLAGLVGGLMGPLIAGIIGAIAINLVDKAITRKRKAISLEQRVDKGNEILRVQKELQVATAKRYDNEKCNTINEISTRHYKAAEFVTESVEEIFQYEGKRHETVFEEIESELEDLLS